MHDIEEESDDYSNEDTNEKENVNMRQSNRNMKRKPSGSGKGSEGGLAEEYGSFCQFKLKGVLVGISKEKAMQKATVGGSAGIKSGKSCKSPGRVNGGVHKLNLNSLGSHGSGGGADLKSHNSAAAFDLILEDFVW